uniref:YebG family protein n=1 Tax=Aeromonas sp. QDB14 TaxID=2989836 RepID=UPI0022E44768
MAVEIKYVVVRGGVEKMTFASKKEADAYDKLLDTADELMTLLAGAPVALAPEQQESLAFYLVLRGILGKWKLTDRVLVNWLSPNTP